MKTYLLARREEGGKMKSRPTVGSRLAECELAKSASRSKSREKRP